VPEPAAVARDAADDERGSLLAYADGGVEGTVVSLHLAASAGGPTWAVDEVQAVPGRGLVGDRYFLEKGFYSDKPGARELTLIELETLEALRQEHGIELTAGETRRNVVTCGVPLNYLVEREFTIGPITVRGIRLCEPCLHLVQVTGKQVLAPLVHRGGLRAQILTGGTIRVGDLVRPTPGGDDWIDVG
jgi:MOSC domain-containing protein YiiM